MHTRALALDKRLTMISQSGKIVAEYLNLAKCMAKELAMVQSLMEEQALGIYTMNGLLNDFALISTPIRTRETLITIEELNDKLINYEGVLPAASYGRDNNLVATNFATKSRQRNQSTQNQGNFNRNQFNRNNGNRKKNDRSYKETCQLCG